MNYQIDYALLAKLKVKASQENKSVEIIIKEILEEGLKDIKIETNDALSKPRPAKKLI